MAGRPISAAGVVALDASEPEPRVLLVHRPAYDDWSLPKGKLHAGEALPACAVREALEETGVRVRLEAPVGDITYPIGSGLKTVHYWRASAIESSPRPPDAEVDKVAWVPVRTALARMSYGDERAMVDKALALPASTAFLIVRHGKAMLRKNWTGRDQARPVDARGRKQSAALVPLLDAYAVGRLDSSTSTRCVQTFKPYAKASGLEVRGWSTLSEELAKGNDKAVTKLMRRLVAEASGARMPTAVCGHRPVLPTMLVALGVEPHPFQTSAVLVTHLDAAGAVVASEFHKPLV